MLQSFSDLGVPADMVAELQRAGITEPTAIQIAALPTLFAGRDLCGGAPTGSGKTLAFGLPLVTALRPARPNRPTGLILSPTRELAGQIHGVLAPLAALRGHKTTSIYGGVGFRGQLTDLRRGVELVVACPGRLEDLLAQGALRLDDVEEVVVDEADRMADMGFLPAVSRILGLTAAKRHTALFSATLDGAVDKLARLHLKDPVRHTVQATTDDSARTTHLFWSTGSDERRHLCAELARAARRTIVFTRTKRGADRVSRQLSEAGVAAAPIHGDRSQAQRDRALAQFHRGEVAVLVATDVAARGIHVDSVACVVHFDPPASAADYLHRSGRTARAGASGVVATFVTDETRSAVRSLQRELRMPQGTSRPDLASLEDQWDPSIPLVVRAAAPERAEDLTVRREGSYRRPTTLPPGSRRGGPSPRRADRPSAASTGAGRPHAGSGSGTGAAAGSGRPPGPGARRNGRPADRSR